MSSDFNDNALELAGMESGLMARLDNWSEIAADHVLLFWRSSFWLLWLKISAFVVAFSLEVVVHCRLMQAESEPENRC